jgi:murein DD-endopeptidase MepM/ murein hydrolase activator NlpD
MLRAFPVDLAARPTFEDTYGAPRPNGRTHEGTDIFAPEGTAVYAVDVGRVEFHPDEGIGGNVAYLHSDDRTRYVYSHLSAFEGSNRRVQSGELIGRVGSTGNAVGLPPHVHFEVHPLEGGPVNPFPELKAARDAALHPELPPEPSPAAPSSPSSPAAAAGLEGAAGIALLLFIGLHMSERRRRKRMN